MSLLRVRMQLLSSCLEGDRVVGIEPSPTNPVNKGMLCVKGWNAYEFIHSPDRLTVPLVRKQGALVESTWDEALKIVSERLTGHKITLWSPLSGLPQLRKGDQ